MADTSEITQLLEGFARGDSAATEQLASLVYGELRRIAALLFQRERRDHSLQPTALVNEAFARLMSGERPSTKSREHFFAVAAQAMRRVLVDHARKKKSGKRGGGGPVLELDEEFGYSDEKSDQLVALDDALSILEKLDRRQSRIIMLTFFAGMTNREVAREMGLGLTTVRRELMLARAWLRREMES